MPAQSGEIAIGMTTLTGALVAGAIFSRLHTGASGDHNPIGDRVVCGLLAAPGFVVVAHLAAPNAAPSLKLVAGLPILIYSALLAATDWNVAFIKDHFTAILLVSIVGVYAAIAACWVGGAT